MEKLARYIIRASFSQERMQYLDHQKGMIVYTSKDGETTKNFPALEWLAAMCSHIPNRGEQMVRYYGYYSNVSNAQERFIWITPEKTFVIGQMAEKRFALPIVRAPGYIPSTIIGATLPHFVANSSSHTSPLLLILPPPKAISYQSIIQFKSLLNYPVIIPCVWQGKDRTTEASKSPTSRSSLNPL